MPRAEEFLKRNWLTLLIYGLLLAFVMVSLALGVQFRVYSLACWDGEYVRVEVLGVNFAPWNEMGISGQLLFEDGDYHIFSFNSRFRWSTAFSTKLEAAKTPAELTVIGLHT